MGIHQWNSGTYIHTYRKEGRKEARWARNQGRILYCGFRPFDPCIFDNQLLRLAPRRPSQDKYTKLSASTFAPCSPTSKSGRIFHFIVPLPCILRRFLPTSRLYFQGQNLPSASVKPQIFLFHDMMVYIFGIIECSTSRCVSRYACSRSVSPVRLKPGTRLDERVYYVA